MAGIIDGTVFSLLAYRSKYDSGGLSLEERERRERVRRERTARATALLPAAVQRGDVSAVAALYRRGGDLRTRCADGRTLRQLAQDNYRWTVVAWLDRPVRVRSPGGRLSTNSLEGPVEFSQYYRELFRRDLTTLLAGHPQPHPHLDDDLCVQPCMLARDTHPIGEWPLEVVELFATALFFTVLVDQVAYTHYHAEYAQFRRDTLYPKFKGDCLAACRQHLAPSDIFRAVARDRTGNYGGPALECPRVMAAALPVMKAQVFSFFSERMPAVDPAAFWDHCLAHLPGWWGAVEAPG